MATHIKDLNIESYRGINELDIKNLGDVNILLGDNNVGKTSVLEAIQLLCLPTEFGMIQVARQRENGRMVLRSRLGIMDSVMFLFNVYNQDKQSKHYMIRIGGNVLESVGEVEISAQVVHQLIDWNNLSDYEKRILKDQGINPDEETPTLVGVIRNSFKTDKQMTFFENKEIKFELNNYSRGARYDRDTDLIGVSMVQTIDHLIGDSLNQLIKDKYRKDRAVELLKEFDETISDIRYIREDNGHRFYPVIENDHQDYIPLSLYGDGMKKVLTMLNAMIGMENGIVLIDEFETALHTSAMKNVFRFLVDLAKELNIQLFLTTHSIEAVDKLLGCVEEDIEKVRVVRLRKKKGLTYAKVIEGREARTGRLEYNMEYRV